jgi:hypothetical protein
MKKAVGSEVKASSCVNVKADKEYGSSVSVDGSKNSAVINIIADVNDSIESYFSRANVVHG